MNIAMTERGALSAERLLEDKIALVTGSTSGIGLGIARALAGAGAAVVLNGFGKPEEIAATQEAVRTDFGVAVAYSGADISKPDAVGAEVDVLGMILALEARREQPDQMHRAAAAIGRELGDHRIAHCLLRQARGQLAHHVPEAMQLLLARHVAEAAAGILDILVPRHDLP